MSLINEALKKAQRQRTEDSAPVEPAPAPAAPGTATAPVARIAKHSPPMPARTLVLLLGGGCALFIMAGVLVFLFYFAGSEPDAPAKPVVVVASPVVAAPSPAPGPTQATTPPVVTPSPVVVTPPSPVVSVQLPPIVTPTPAPTPAPVPAPTPAPVVTAPPVPKPAPVVVPPAPREPVANPAVYEFLEKLRVSGVRASATDPKVIMNDRVFRLNDIVDKTLQLRLIRVDNSALIFSDASGFEYRKSL
ncbi:MAG: hypothetical protein H7Y06_14305 [Opitutaceae bacterium]|nr:hypothetical protein [Opitutaceae bacterium]